MTDWQASRPRRRSVSSPSLIDRSGAMVKPSWCCRRARRCAAPGAQAEPLWRKPARAPLADVPVRRCKTSAPSLCRWPSLRAWAQPLRRLRSTGPRCCRTAWRSWRSCSAAARSRRRLLRGGQADLRRSLGLRPARRQPDHEAGLPDAHPALKAFVARIAESPNLASYLATRRPSELKAS